MKFKTYLNENVFQQAIKPLRKLDFSKAKDLLKKDFEKMIDIILKNGLEKQALAIINQYTKTNISSLKSLKKMNESTLNEDAKNFWNVFKMEGWPAISVFPALSLWFEFDKLLDGRDLDLKKVVIYGTLWLILIMSKHIAGWRRWKKEHPDEFEKEGSKKNPFAK